MTCGLRAGRWARSPLAQERASRDLHAFACVGLLHVRAGRDSRPLALAAPRMCLRPPALAESCSRLLLLALAAPRVRSLPPALACCAPPRRLRPLASFSALRPRPFRRIPSAFGSASVKPRTHGHSDRKMSVSARFYGVSVRECEVLRGPKLSEQRGWHKTAGQRVLLETEALGACGKGGPAP